MACQWSYKYANGRWQTKGSPLLGHKKMGSMGVGVWGELLFRPKSQHLWKMRRASNLFLYIQLYITSFTFFTLCFQLWFSHLQIKLHSSNKRPLNWDLATLLLSHPKSLICTYTILFTLDFPVETWPRHFGRPGLLAL